MRDANLHNKSFDYLSFSALALLAPTILWWAMLALSLTIWKGFAEAFGGNILEIVVLVVCTLLAAFLSFAAVERTNKKLYLITGVVGVLLGAAALVASFRIS